MVYCSGSQCVKYLFLLAFHADVKIMIYMENIFVENIYDTFFCGSVSYVLAIVKLLVLM